MNRKKFVGITGVTLAAIGSATYLFSDNHSIVRNEIEPHSSSGLIFRKNERDILYLASLAPSGHNTQPWLIKYVEPYHWIVGNDKSKWLPAVDPKQRETILSIGAFIQNLEYAASHYGYSCQWNMLATSNQDENIMEVRLRETVSTPDYDISTIQSRRTVRSHYKSDRVQNNDLEYFTAGDKNYLHYIPSGSKLCIWLNEQTIEANQLQTYRDTAQQELANWIRFSSKDAKKYRDGLTTASMEIAGMSGLIVRNFYGATDVMKKGFRNKSLDTVKITS